MSQFFASGGQSIGASVSASVLPMHIQGWLPLGLTGWISLLSKGLSRVFSAPQFESISSSVLSFLYGPTLTSIHDYWKSHESKSDSCSVVSDSFWPHELKPARFLCPWNSPGQNTGVGCHSLLQGIFLIKGSNPGLQHCKQILYHLSHQGSFDYMDLCWQSDVSAL